MWSTHISFQLIIYFFLSSEERCSLCCIEKHKDLLFRDGKMYFVKFIFSASRSVVLCIKVNALMALIVFTLALLEFYSCLAYATKLNEGKCDLFFYFFPCLLQQCLRICICPSSTCIKALELTKMDLHCCLPFVHVYLKWKSSHKEEFREEGNLHIRK